MPNHCCVVGCSNTYKTHKMFWFPHAMKEPESRKIWTNNVNRKDWSPGEHSFICSKHFVDGKPTEINPYPTLEMGWNCPAGKKRRKLSPSLEIPNKSAKTVEIVLNNGGTAEKLIHEEYSYVDQYVADNKRNWVCILRPFCKVQARTAVNVEEDASVEVFGQHNHPSVILDGAEGVATSFMIPRRQWSFADHDYDGYKEVVDHESIIETESDQVQFVRSLLPTEWDYKITNIDGDNSNDLVITLRIKISTREEYSEWKDEFEKCTGIWWKFDHGEEDCTKALFYEFSVCHRSSWKKEAPNNSGGETSRQTTERKSTGCLATMKFKIKKPTLYVMKTDKFARHGYFGLAEINWNHNHSINPDDYLRFKKADQEGKETKEIFFEYFNCGLNPGQARHHHQQQLTKQKAFANDISLDVSQKSLIPNPSTVYSWYYAWKKFKGNQNLDSPDISPSSNEFVDSCLATNKLIENNSSSGESSSNPSTPPTLEKEMTHEKEQEQCNDQRAECLKLLKEISDVFKKRIQNCPLNQLPLLKSRLENLLKGTKSPAANQ